MSRLLALGGMLLLALVLPRWHIPGEVCSEPWLARFRVMRAPFPAQVWALRYFRRARGLVPLSACLDAAGCP